MSPLNSWLLLLALIAASVALARWVMQIDQRDFTAEVEPDVAAVYARAAAAGFLKQPAPPEAAVDSVSDVYDVELDTPDWREWMREVQT